MIWLIGILAVAFCVSLWVNVRLSRATKALLKVIHGYAVQSETSSTSVDRVTYTVALHRTETLGPIE